MMNKLGMDDFQVTGLKVLMRVDFNVPLDADRNITDETRITAALPSINYILSHGGSVILMSHLGRPKGKIDPELSLRPVADRLAELVEAPVKFARDTVGPDAVQKAENLQPGEILLLENHGILTTGSSLLQAFDRIEVLESAAKMTLIVEIMKNKSPLSKSRILEIEKKFR